MRSNDAAASSYADSMIGRASFSFFRCNISPSSVVIFLTVTDHVFFFRRCHFFFAAFLFPRDYNEMRHVLSIDFSPVASYSFFSPASLLPIGMIFFFFYDIDFFDVCNAFFFPGLPSFHHLFAFCLMLRSRSAAQNARYDLPDARCLSRLLRPFLLHAARLPLFIFSLPHHGSSRKNALYFSLLDAAA